MKLETIPHFFLTLGLCFVSCKNISENSKEKKNDETLYEDQLLIEVNATVQADDVFELYFRNKGETYDQTKSRQQIVSGKNEEQKIVFGLNQHEYPYNLRIDFGNNPKQGDIYIHSIALIYNEGRHEFSKEELRNHFVPNKFLDIDFEKMLLKTKVIDNKYDPFLQSNNISAFVNKLILY